MPARSLTPDTPVAGDTLALDPANVIVAVLNSPAIPDTDQNEAPVILRIR